MGCLNKIRTYKKSNCPCCGGVGKTIYHDLRDKLFGAPGTWSISKCGNQNCASLWLNPAPVESDLHLAYQSYYTHSVVRSNSLSFFRRMVRGYQSLRFDYLSEQTNFIYRFLGVVISVFGFIREHMNFPFLYLKNQRKAKLLEIGVGSGANLKKFIDWGWSADGLDFDAKAVEACKAQGLNVMHGDLASQNFTEGQYDAMFSSHVLEHVPDPKALFRESFRVLSGGGVFVAVTPNANSLLHRLFKRAWRGLEPPRHLQIFTRQALKKLAAESGFSRVEVHSSNLSSAEIFMYSAALRFKLQPKFLLKILAFFVRILLNFYHFFAPMSGEELILVAFKR